MRNELDKHYILRVASLYGAKGSCGKGGNFVYTVLDKAKSGSPLRIVNDLFMSPTYTVDVSNRIWKMLQEKAAFGTYHTTNAGECSWYEFAQEIVRLGGLDVSIEQVSFRDFEIKARRPRRCPLRTEKGNELRSWKSAIAEFIGHL